jgi:aldehyde:ferredoxin oxidoreductase
MTDTFGYCGKILRINLTNETIEIDKHDSSFYRTYMGGRNIALHYLLKEVPTGIQADDPENRLIFMASVTTGAPISGQARHTAAALSPLTGGLADSQCGGWWGAELKFAGWDGIVIHGKATRKVYLAIEDDIIEFRSADDLWGKETGEVDEILHQKHTDKCKILQIGPAGENLVKFACITCDLRHYHGRGGLGAVMGSKNLRAIVVKASKRKIRIADPEGLLKHASWFARSTKGHPAISLHHELGTPKGVMSLSVSGMLPTYNFQDGSFNGAKGISGETMNEVLNGKAETCFGCAVACKRSVEGKKGTFNVTRRYGGPEYETIGLLGSNLGVNDIHAVAYCNERCNALGIDTISAGLTLSWAIECFERGLIGLEDTQGIDLKWNDPETYVDILDLIAKRSGLGELLAEGSRGAARRIGRDTEKYSISVKGQEVAAHEPRGKWGVALGYAVSPTGGDHLQAAHDPWFEQPGDDSTECNWVDLKDLSPLGLLDPMPSQSIGPEKVRLFVYLQYVWSLHDVLNWCIFTTVPEFRAMSLNRLVEVVASITGWKCSLFELLKAGERGITMARAFNYRHGFTAADDAIPERFFEPMRDGTLKGVKIDKAAFDQAVELYYGMMGWDTKGMPTRAKLIELNLEWVAKLFD